MLQVLQGAVAGFAIDVAESNINVTDALEKVSGAQLRLSGRYKVVKSQGASSKRHR